VGKSRFSDFSSRGALLLCFVAACGGEFTAADVAGTSGGGAGTTSAGPGGGAGATGGSAETGGSSGVAGSEGGAAGASGGGTIGDASSPPPADAGSRRDGGATSDARTVTDAAQDAPTTIGSSFCSLVAHTFCADFDPPDTLARWSNSILHSGGALVISPAAAASAPNSLLVTAPASPDTMSSSEAILQKNFAVGITKQAHLSLDLQTSSIAQYGSSNAITLSNGNTAVMIVLSDAGGLVGCNVNLLGSTAAVQPVACPVAMTLGQWNHFDLVVKPQGSNLQITLILDGSPISFPFPVTSWSGMASLEVGSYPGNPTKYWKGFIDNVAIDIE
jgi:hypothetical protein